MTAQLPQLVALLPCLLPLALLLLAAGAVQRQRAFLRLGAALALVGGLGLGLIVAEAGLGARSALTALRAHLVGYGYDPRAQRPDPALLPVRPETDIGRQLDALVGRQGQPPLRDDAALVGYEIERVRVAGWTDLSLTAEVTARLRFDDGATREVRLRLISGGGRSLTIPWFGGHAHLGGWRDSTLAPLLREPAPGSSLSGDPAPIRLRQAATIVMLPLADGEATASGLWPSDVARDGRVLLDQDARDPTGSALFSDVVLRGADGTRAMVDRTFISARARFSPDGERVLYVRSSGVGQPLQLVTRAADGTQREIATVDGVAHHWVDNERVAYRAGGQVVLHDLRADTRRTLATLAPEGLGRADTFQVAPGGGRVAHADAEGRLWVREVATGEATPIGWDVSNAGWGAGMAWDAAGERLLFATMNSATLPDQAEVWLWDVRTRKTTLLARAPARFLNSDYVYFDEVCWADAQTVLFVADRRDYSSARLLAARADGSALWDVTPPDQTIPNADVSCAGGHLAALTSPDKVTLYRIEAAE